MKLHRWSVFVLTLIVSCASCSSKENQGVTADASQPHSSASLTVTGDPNVWLEEWRKTTFVGKDPKKLWEQYSRAAHAELSRPGADPSDITSKADALGRDPQKIFEFIRDQVALEPYAGVLRGARGSLMAGAGNSLDRALLAQELLKISGIEHRLIVGKLSDTQASSLFERFLDDSRVPQLLTDLRSTTSDSELRQLSADMSERVGIPANSVIELVLHDRAQGKEFWAKTNAQREKQFSFLSGQLQKRGENAPIDGAVASTKFKGQLRKHYWLQTRELNGAWSDFDPTFADAKRGVAYGTDSAQLSEIPEEDFHQLHFSLVYQTIADGTPKKEILVAGTFASASALFESPTFRILPADIDAKPDELFAMDVKQKIDVLRGIKRFEAILRSGSKIVSGRTFDLDGRTYDGASNPLGGAGGSFFGDAFGGADVESTPQFVDLHVELRLTGPGRKPLNQTRTLVRAEDVMAPTFAPPLLGWDILLQPQWISAKFVAFRDLSQAVATGDALAAAVDSGRLEDFYKKLLPPDPSLLHQMALLRQVAAADILGNRSGVKAFIDEPFLTISGTRITDIREDEGVIIGERHIDIVENAVRYVAKGENGQRAAFDAALRQGVADSAIEHFLLDQVFPGPNNWSGATIVAKAQGEQRPVLFAKTRDVERLKSAGMSNADIEWIHRNESPSAQLVVATTTSGNSAWWSIRPDGNAILRSREGVGATFTETVINYAGAALRAIGAVLEFGLYLNCIWETSTFLLEGLPHAVHGAKFPTHEAIGVALCVAAGAGGAYAKQIHSHLGEAAMIFGEMAWHAYGFRSGSH